MQMPPEQCTGGDEDHERTPVEGHGQDSSIGDSENAVILTARRVKIVRCRAKQTTLSSVRFQPVIFHRMQPITTSVVDGRVKRLSQLVELRQVG